MKAAAKSKPLTGQRWLGGEVCWATPMSSIVASSRRSRAPVTESLLGQGAASIHCRISVAQASLLADRHVVAQPSIDGRRGGGRSPCDRPPVVGGGGQFDDRPWRTALSCPGTGLRSATTTSPAPHHGSNSGNRLVRRASTDVASQARRRRGNSRRRAGCMLGEDACRTRSGCRMATFTSSQRADLRAGPHVCDGSRLPPGKTSRTSVATPEVNLAIVASVPARTRLGVRHRPIGLRGRLGVAGRECKDGAVRRNRAALITDAERSQDDQLMARESRYVIMMGIRVVCLVAAAVLVGVHAPLLKLVAAAVDRGHGGTAVAGGDPGQRSATEGEAPAVAQAAPAADRAAPAAPGAHAGRAEDHRPRRLTTPAGTPT